MNSLQLVACSIHGEEYAIEIKNVQEIIRVAHITRVPYSRACLSGVINLRGRVIPVMDMGKRIRLPELSINDSSRIIVVSREDIIAGLLVDGVSEVFRLPLLCLENTSILSHAEEAEMYTGIGKFDGRVLLIFNLDKVLETGGCA